MIVIDASIMVELLLLTDRVEQIGSRLRAESQAPHCPELLDLEVLQALRRYSFKEKMTPERTFQILEDFSTFRLQRHRHEHLLPRVWELRHDMTAYDASYVVLAESLDATLITRDAKLASTASRLIEVEVL